MTAKKMKKPRSASKKKKTIETTCVYLRRCIPSLTRTPKCIIIGNRYESSTIFVWSTHKNLYSYFRKALEAQLELLRGYLLTIADEDIEVKRKIG